MCGAFSDCQVVKPGGRGRKLLPLVFVPFLQADRKRSMMYGRGRCFVRGLLLCPFQGRWNRGRTALCCPLSFLKGRSLHAPRTKLIDRERTEKADLVRLPAVSVQPAAGPLQCGGYAGGGKNCRRNRPGRHQQCLHAVLYHQFPLYRPDHGRERFGGPVQGGGRPKGTA